jgi:hypothetical protein
MRRLGTPTASIQICLRNVGKLAVHTSLGAREVTYGSTSGDLSDETRDALWEKHKSQLAFPAGLEDGHEAARIVARELQDLMANDLAAPDLESRIRECLVGWVMQAAPDLESSLREDLVQYVQHLV